MTTTRATLQEQLAKLLATPRVKPILTQPKSTSKGMRMLPLTARTTKQVVADLAESPVQNDETLVTPPTDSSIHITPPAASGVTVTPLTEPSNSDVPLASIAKIRTTFRGLDQVILTESGASPVLIHAATRSKSFALKIEAYFKGNRSPEARLIVDQSKWISNSVQSLKEAAANFDLSGAEITEVKAGSLSRLRTIEAYMTKDYEGSFDAAPPASTVVASIKSTGVRLDSLHGKYFEQFIRHKSKLPTAVGMTKKGLRFKALKLPVVVIFNKIVNAPDLVDEGFDVEDAGGYIVLLEQNVWAINVKKLDKDEVWDGNESLYIERLLVQAKKRMGHQFTLVGPENKVKISYPSTQGVNYYWVMPSREARVLPSSVKDWGFPF